MAISKNNDIRNEARNKGVALWQVALALGVCETTLLRWLRVELPQEKGSRILEAIDAIAKDLYGERS